MKFAIDVPNFGEYADARMLAGLARDAEQAGWDGFFIWDHIALPWPAPMVDAWVALSAIAASTISIRIGPMVIPLSRRRPWKVAREAVSLDHLSNGRLILGVGLGSGDPTEYENLGEVADPKTRASMLDEGLDVLTGLWSGQPFTFDGEHYHVKDALFLPPPVQQPRIPIWVAGYWPNKAPFRRAARWDGAFPAGRDLGPMDAITPEQLRGVVAFIKEHRTSDAPFDVVHQGYTEGKDPAADTAVVAPYAEAGATWWVEPIHGLRGSLDEMRDRVMKGPPRLF